MRLPYIPDPPPTSSPEEQAIVDRIRARRHPRPLQLLDRALLHSPPVADGWNAFLGAIRDRTGETLPADLRELAIARVAVANRAWYEYDHHAPLARAAGVAEEGMRLVRELPVPVSVGEGGIGKGEGWKEGDGEVPEGLTERQWVVLCYTDEMTRNVEVREGTFARMRRLFGEREIVEITATIACYNCVSRFLVALDVGERNGTGPSASH